VDWNIISGRDCRSSGSTVQLSNRV